MFAVVAGVQVMRQMPALADADPAVLKVLLAAVFRHLVDVPGP